MILNTVVGVPMEGVILYNYICALIDHIFKILPVWEKREYPLGTYMKSLQEELLGCRTFVKALQYDPMLLSIISILQYLIDNPSSEIQTVRRQVFRAISICKKLRKKYAHLDDEEVQA